MPDNFGKHVEACFDEQVDLMGIVFGSDEERNAALALFAEGVHLGMEEARKIYRSDES